MRIGTEFINPQHVVYVSSLYENSDFVDQPFALAVECVNGKIYKFYFGSKEFGNRNRNELIGLVEGLTS